MCRQAHRTTKKEENWLLIDEIRTFVETWLGYVVHLVEDGGGGGLYYFEYMRRNFGKRWIKETLQWVKLLEAFDSNETICPS